MRSLQRFTLALAFTSACSGWVRVDNAHDITKGHAVRIGEGRGAIVMSHVTPCDRYGFGVAPPGCSCDRACTIDVRHARFYVHDALVDPGVLTTVFVVLGLAALGGYLLSIEIH